MPRFRPAPCRLQTRHQAPRVLTRRGTARREATVKGAIRLLELAWHHGFVVNDEACAAVLLAVDRVCACARAPHPAAQANQPSLQSAPIAGGWSSWRYGSHLVRGG
jgi:hypothetical protein